MKMADETETQEKINQLQLYEQSIQNILLQKQQFKAQETEIESALKELKDSKEQYKIVGNIMVKSDKESLEKELESKKSQMELRLKSLEKQESGIKEKMQALQKEVMEKIGKEK
jgi:prefoldin beta subunit